MKTINLDISLCDQMCVALPVGKYLDYSLLEFDATQFGTHRPVTKMHSATYQEKIILNTKIFSLPHLTEYITVHVQVLYLSSKTHKPALVPIQPTIQWTLKFFPRVPLTSV